MHLDERHFFCVRLILKLIYKNAMDKNAMDKNAMNKNAMNKDAMDKSAFIEACINSDYEAIDSFINRRHYISIMNIVCEYGTIDIMDYLLEKYNLLENYSLEQVCRFGNLEMVKYFVETISLYEDYELAMSVACDYNKQDIVEYLIDRFDFSDYEYLCEFCNTAALKYAVDKYKLPVNASLLDMACNTNDISMVKYVSSLLTAKQVLAHPPSLSATRDYKIVQHLVDTFDLMPCLDKLLELDNYNMVAYIGDRFPLDSRQIKKVFSEACYNTNLNILKYLIEKYGISYEYLEQDTSISVQMIKLVLDNIQR
jgi:hypothetical protein